MNILGLQKTTLLDFPGHVAATIFLGGCNFRCPFCHNMNIVLANESSYTEEYIISFLKRRSGILDGICITGGEPTLYSDLPQFIHTVKNLGLKVKLDTNGTNPEMIRHLLSLSLIDYIAMDIKSSIDNYDTITSIANLDVSTILETINLLKNSSIEYEFRTTLIKNYHTPEVINSIGKLIAGDSKYYLQSFTDSEFVPNHNLIPFTKEELLLIKEQLLPYVPNVSIRGVDI